MAIPTTPTLLQLDNLYDILVELGENVRRGYVNKLVKNGHPTQENTLASTVTSEVIVKGTTYEVVLNLQDYWKYVEEGTEPHWPPRQAILDWIKIKPVIPRPDDRGRIPTPEQLAFLISRKISREGTEGSHDLQTAEDAVIPMWEERLLDALQRDTLEYIRKITEV
jgi:hypothetical protein